MAEDTATIPTVDIDVASKSTAPHLEALLFADYAIEAKDGKAVVAGVIDQVFVDPDKRIVGRFFIYMRTSETLGAPVELIICDPKGRLVATGKTEVIEASEKLPPAPRSVNVFLPFSFQMGPEGIDGVYWFDVQFKGQSLGGAALRVTFRKMEGA